MQLRPRKASAQLQALKQTWHYVVLYWAFIPLASMHHGMWLPRKGMTLDSGLCATGQQVLPYVETWPLCLQSCGMVLLALGLLVPSVKRESLECGDLVFNNLQVAWHQGTTNSC